MGVYYRASLGVASMKLFEDSPNIAGQAVRTAVLDNVDIPDQLLITQLRGYNRNARDFYKYAEKYIPDNFPSGLRSLNLFDQDEVNRVTHIKAREQLTNSATIISDVAIDMFNNHANLQASYHELEAQFYAVYASYEEADAIANVAEVTADQKEAEYWYLKAIADVALADFYPKRDEYLRLKAIADPLEADFYAKYATYESVRDDPGSTQAEIDAAYSIALQAYWPAVNAIEAKDAAYAVMMVSYNAGLPSVVASNNAYDSWQLAELHATQTRQAADDLYALAEVIYILGVDVLHQAEQAHADYLIAQQKSDTAWALVNTFKISFIASKYVTQPDRYLESWEYLYQFGLFFPTGPTTIEGAPFVQNTQGYYPALFVESIVIPPRLPDDIIYNPNPEITVKAVWEDGSISYHSIVYVIPHNYAGRIYTGYKIEGVGSEVLTEDYLIWSYDYESGEYPLIIPDPNREGAAHFPIVPIRYDRENVNEGKSVDGSEQTDEYKYANRALKKINVDINDLTEQLMSAEGADEIDDAYVLFGASLVSKIPSVIEYNIEFFSALRGYEGLPYYPREKASLLLDDKAYRDAFPNIELGLQATTLTYNYKIKTKETVDQDLGGKELYHMEFRCRYIYDGILDWVIGPRGATTCVVTREIPNSNENDYGDYRDFGVGYIDYAIQINDTQARLVRIHHPCVRYIDQYDVETLLGPWAQYDLLGYRQSLDSGKERVLQDSDEQLRVPLMQAITRVYSGITEAEIYIDSLIMIIYSVHITKVYGWQIFIKALVIIILAIIALVTGRIEFLIAYIVVTAVTYILAKILNATLDRASAAKGIAGAGIALSVLSLNFANIANVVLQLIGMVTQLISSIKKIKLLELTEDILELSSEGSLEERRLDELEQSLFGNTVFDPLMVGGLHDFYETPDDYYSNRLKMNPSLEGIDGVHVFHTNALELPEMVYLIEQQRTRMDFYSNDVESETQLFKQ